MKSSGQIAWRDRQGTLAPELRGERKNICEGLEHVQEENLKGKGCKILGMIYREAYQGQSPDPTFLFALVFWKKKKTMEAVLGHF